MLKFKYQQNIGTDIPISDNSVNINPIVVDYSARNKYNTSNSKVIRNYTIEEDGGQLFISDVISILNSNVYLTTKKDIFGNPLFYQYQPKYDIELIDNVQIKNKDGEDIPYHIEYATVVENGTTRYISLSENDSLFYDSLNGFTLNGVVNSDDISYSYLLSGLPFNINKKGLRNGSIKYPEALFTVKENKILSFYFYKTALNNLTFLKTDNLKLDTVGTDISIKLNDSEINTVTFAIETWYRIDILNADTSILKIYNMNDGTLVDTISITGEVLNGDVYLECDNYTCIFDFALLDTDTNKPWAEHTHVGRYSSDIIWTTTPSTNTKKFIRFLFKENIEAILSYTALTIDSFIQNKKEMINYETIYKKYDSNTIADWTYSEDSNRSYIYFINNLKSEIEDNSLTEVYLLLLEDTNMKVFYDESDKKIHVRNSTFRSNNFGENGEFIYYNLPEYSMLGFASDQEQIIQPKCLRIYREVAQILDEYTIKVQPFYLYEGIFPTYSIPNTYELRSSLNPYTETIIQGDDTYISQRGINIFINGHLIDNSQIINYNMSAGLIQINQPISSNDTIEVTYLRVTNDFIIQFPIINAFLNSGSEGGIGDSQGIRIYLRPQYNNYSSENPTDFQTERLCYQLFSDSLDSNVFRSCLTNEVVDANAVLNNRKNIVHLADVSIIKHSSFSDIRILGGGIKESERLSYKKSSSFIDIGYLPNGKLLYKSFLIIKIKKQVLTDLVNNYFYNDEAEAVKYIKKQIEKYKSSGAFYVIIDENNKLWDSPYPLCVTAKYEVFK